MKFSRATIIVNPASGRGSSTRDVERFRRELRTCVEHIELVWTRQQGDAVRLARDAVETGSDLIVAVGGDGTVNEVVNGMAAAGRRTRLRCTLGMVPTGTSCSLAKELAISPGPASLKVIAEGRTRTVDLAALKWLTPQGEMKERLATTVTNFGFGGAVAKLVGTRSKRLGAFLAFGTVATAQFFRYEAVEMRVEIDGTEIVRSPLLCTIVANTQWEGGGMRVAPQAKPDDGLLDVVMVDDLPLLSRLRHFPKVYKGKHLSLDTVRHARGRRISVSSASTVPFEFDGEPAECRECRIEVLPQALRVLVPA